jgi:hypothetical protein
MGSENRADQAWDFLSNWFTSGFLWVAVTLPAVPGRAVDSERRMRYSGQARAGDGPDCLPGRRRRGATGAILGISVILSIKPAREPVPAVSSISKQARHEAFA